MRIETAHGGEDGGDIRVTMLKPSPIRGEQCLFIAC